MKLEKKRNGGGERKIKVDAEEIVEGCGRMWKEIKGTEKSPIAIVTIFRFRVLIIGNRFANGRPTEPGIIGLTSYIWTT